MKLFVEITEITEALAKNGAETLWECQLGDGDSFAWQAPMLGDGGSTSELSLSSHLVRYAGLEDRDPSDGPDECVFTEGGKHFHAIITVE